MDDSTKKKKKGKGASIQLRFLKAKRIIKFYATDLKKIIYEKVLYTQTHTLEIYRDEKETKMKSHCVLNLIATSRAQTEWKMTRGISRLPYLSPCFKVRRVNITGKIIVK